MIKNIYERILGFFKSKELYIAFAATLVFFGMFIIKDYTVDSYLFFKETWREPFYHFLGLGRLVSAAAWISVCKTNFATAYLISFAVAIISTTVSIYKLNQILYRDIKNKKITMLISIITVINIFSLELFMFYEKGIMTLSVLFNILAIGHIENALKFEKKSIKSMILILVYMFLANCSYQGTVGLFVTIATVYIVKNSRSILTFILNNIVVAILYAIPALANYAITRFIFKSTRLNEQIFSIEKIKNIIQITKIDIINTFDIMPKYLFLTMIVLFVLLYIIKSIKNKKNIFLCLFFIVYIVVANLFATMAPQVMQSYVYVVPRNIYSLGAILGVILMIMYFNDNKTKIIDTIIIVISTIFMFMMFYNFVDITLDHYKTNFEDRLIVSRIKDKVINYENETGAYVNKLVIYKNEFCALQYEGTRWIGDANVRAFFTDWGIRGILDEELERQVFQVEGEDESIKEYFDNKSSEWKGFSEEQVVLKDDTLYLYVY